MSEQDVVLSEQVAYYRIRAADYLERHRLIPGFDELARAVTAFGPSGAVLELACGPGTWTPMLLRTATTVTAVDAAPEMLDQARRQVGDARVEFVQADLFSWRPSHVYDTVFFGFWLSHVPPGRFDSFWRLVDASLAPDGRVFFIDDAWRTSDEVRGGQETTTIVRRTADGDEHRLVKAPYTSEALQKRLASLGWLIEVHDVIDGLFWGSGTRMR
ncbi:demethylmenaquinone methyltransferase / 2-methoxy-6-polyprenyl-1,4-benzoquinol methylase [Blastococcus aurantiacus]|uniref:Demethylmenaquinone methyltransferase / 2-methoxy-6-polyprenyl-1,4-benzoquinol methylase n=1 Tax=Blastococcus aurantiacus TaxID=1550231 RepID=A0A1G7HHL6_9ACTN|nr:class I SAM-dependent methyltransferase [Blastococcus aurantiacus]SDE99972.1 demethylmenaquinone methyltransferase / 2-methoxy-6-polyprenyl-1,4-benzoquinol methylase [Blastococcus aurantiacus]